MNTAKGLGAPTLEPAPSLIGSINPLARIIGLFILSTTLMLTVDWVSGTVAIILELLVLLTCGAGIKRIFRYTWYLWLLAPMSSISVILYSAPGGEIYFQWGMIQISDKSIHLGIAVAIRVIALALPALALFIDTDPTRAADALAQNGRLPARFVLAALTSVRMIDRLVSDWHSVEYARRARGLADSNWFLRIKQVSFSLLVMALRRASDLATAMESRGFGASTPRTWARPSIWLLRDWAAIGVAVMMAAIAIGCAVYAGTFCWFGL